MFTGILSAIFSGFLVFTFLEPLFVPIRSDTAMVFLYILAIFGSLVGMSLGVLLPSMLSGVCLGGSLALLIEAFMNMNNLYMFPILAGSMALVFAAISSR